jgi:hypothetical protein
MNRASFNRLMSLAIIWASAGLIEAAEQPPAVASADWTENLEPISGGDWNYDRAAHLLERAGFGGTPEEVEKLATMTPAEAVDYLVEYESIDVSHLPQFEERSSPVKPSGSMPDRKERCRSSPASTSFTPCCGATTPR